MSDYKSLIRNLKEQDKKNYFLEQKNYKKWLSEKQHGLCRFISQDSHLQSRNILNAYHLLASSANNRIRMQIPAIDISADEPQKNLFETIKFIANQSQAQVDLIANAHGFIKGKMLDFKLKKLDITSFLGYKRFYAYKQTNRLGRQLKDSDINIHVHRSWMHSKAFFFDDIALSIGSFNLDDSATTWAESTVICMDPELSYQALRMFEKDKADSIFLDSIQKM